MKRLRPSVGGKVLTVVSNYSALSSAYLQPVWQGFILWHWQRNEKNCKHH